LKVLKLSAQGLPQSWISLEEAVLHYAADEVRWEMGAEVAVFHGGHNAVTGRQSIITVNSIIGTQGVPRINPFDLRPTLAQPLGGLHPAQPAHPGGPDGVPDVSFAQDFPSSRLTLLGLLVLLRWPEGAG